MKKKKIFCDYHKDCDSAFSFFSIHGLIQPISRCLFNHVDQYDMVISVFAEILLLYYVKDNRIMKHSEENYNYFLRDRFLSDASDPLNSSIKKLVKLSVQGYES